MAKIYCYRPAITDFLKDLVPEKTLYLYTYKAVTLLLLNCNCSSVAMDITSNIPLAPEGVFAEEQKHFTKGNMLTDGMRVTQWTCVMDLTH